MGARGPALREWVSQKLPSKRHVFSAIYLLFNRKTSKNPCIRAGYRPTARRAVIPREFPVQASVLFVDQNVTFFPRFTFYLTEKRPNYPALGGRPSTRRSWLCLIHRSKRHVFSAIYLLFNRKRAIFPCIRENEPYTRARGPSRGIPPAF